MPSRMTRTLLVAILMGVAMPMVPAEAAHPGDPADPWEWPADPPDALGPDPDAAVAAAAAAGLFGGFAAYGASYTGTFVSATLEADGRLTDFTLEGEPWLDELRIAMDTPTVHVDGPALLLHDAGHSITLHDNPHGWLSMRTSVGAAVTLTFPEGTTLDENVRGIAFSREELNGTLWYATQDTPGVTIEDHVLTLTGEAGLVDFVITREAGIFGHAYPPGTWALVYHHDGTTVADMLRVSGGGSTLADHLAPDSVDIHLDATVPPGSETVRVRVEVAGLYPPARLSQHVVGTGNDLFMPGDPVALAPSKGPSAFNVSAGKGDEGVLVFDVRLRHDDTGRQSFRQDTTPPTVTSVSTHNLTDVAWDPARFAPVLVSRTNEPAGGSLVIDRPGAPYVKQTVPPPGPKQTFGLKGLDPGTTYTYTLTLADLAGNTVVETGELTTPERDPHVHVDITITGPGARVPSGTDVELVATLEAADGLPVHPGRIAVFVDKNPVSVPYQVDGNNISLLLGVLGDGAHSVTVEVQEDGFPVAHAVHTFHVGAVPESPGVHVSAMLMAILGLVFVLRRRTGGQRGLCTRAQMDGS